MKLLTCALLTLLALPLGSDLASRSDSVRDVERVLSDFHAAAAEADADRYLGHLAPDAVLFGTDASERWTYEDYVARVRPAMERGIRITNIPLEQNVFVSSDDRFAWFDERLEKPKYGELRATGVLRRTEAGWRIVQFHLTLPVPNEVVQDVVKLVRAAQKQRR